MNSLEAFRQAAEKLKNEWPKAREEILEIFGGPELKYYTNPQKHLEPWMDMWRMGPAFPFSKSLKNLPRISLQRVRRKIA